MISERERARRFAALRLDPNRLKLACQMIATAREYRRGGCDDMDLPDSLSDDECARLKRDMYTWNGDPENATTGRGTSLFFVEAYLVAALLKMAEGAVGGAAERPRCPVCGKPLKTVRYTDDRSPYHIEPCPKCKREGPNEKA